MTHRFRRPLHVRRTLAGAGSAAALVLLAACSDSTTEPPPPPTTSELTVDASQAAAFVKLGDPATKVTVSDPTTSSDWDLSFFATSVSVNGGASGPGGVTAFCLCANANASVAQLQSMTSENQLAAFDAVTSANVPPAASFVADALNPAISGWFSGTGSSAAAVTTRSWIVRRTVPNVILAKFRVTAISGATATSAGNVTVEYAIQPSVGAAFGSVSTTTLNLASGPVYLDLSSGPVAQTAAWDLRLSGFEIRTNGGVSGTGGVGAVLDETTPFAQITSAYAASAPPVAYRSDSFGGVFVSSPWYRYNITGTDNQIWPNFNVYLVKRGETVFKVQITGYYGPSGTSRQITVRSSRVP
jgi:heme-binding HmuY-like protein